MRWLFFDFYWFACPVSVLASICMWMDGKIEAILQSHSPVLLALHTAISDWNLKSNQTQPCLRLLSACSFHWTSIGNSPNVTKTSAETQASELKKNEFWLTLHEYKKKEISGKNELHKMHFCTERRKSSERELRQQKRCPKTVESENAELRVEFVEIISVNLCVYFHLLKSMGASRRLAIITIINISFF